MQVPLPSNVALLIDCFGHRLQLGNAADSPERQTMHVQGLSHWAPANIGPYSQSVVLAESPGDGLIYVAGQIGLVPGSMEMVRGGPRCECQLALRHVDRVLKAAASGSGAWCVRLAICYVVSRDVMGLVCEEWQKYLTKNKASLLGISGVGSPHSPVELIVPW